MTLEKNKGTLTKSEDTIEFDMKGTRRKRDNQLEASPCPFIHILYEFHLDFILIIYQFIAI